MENVKSNEDEIPKLELQSTIGYQGKIRDGLIAHPDRFHLVYGIGNNIIITHVVEGTQISLSGHTNSITCLAMSKDGSLLASGQITAMGFKARVIIWDFMNKEIYGSYELHRTKVEAVAFSCEGNLVISLGGQDCRQVMIWDARRRIPICGSQSATHLGHFQVVVKPLQQYNTVFVTAGRDQLRIWNVQLDDRRVHPVTISSGHMKRDFLCLEVDAKDEFLYCGTSSGDVLKFKLTVVKDEKTDKILEYNARMILRLGKTTNREVIGDTPFFCMGVAAIAWWRGNLIIGTGEGIVSMVMEKEVFPKDKDRLDKKIAEIVPASKKPIDKKSETRLHEIIRTRVTGAVSVITLRGYGHQFFVGTTTCCIFRVAMPEFECTLIHTCHGSSVKAIAYPAKCPKLFATCGLETVRIWNIDTYQELLRVTVPNMCCDAVFFSIDGQSIVTGWNDGKIRAYTPSSGTLIYIIDNAHQKGVTALTGTSDSTQLISGGGEGEVRVWDLGPTSQSLFGVLKEHRGAVTSIHITKDDSQCVTSGGDGTCIIWSIVKLNRIRAMFCNALVQAACYGPKECQVVTCGTDRKITYWEVFDGSKIREVKGSNTGPINDLDISEDCNTFVSGGSDKIIKLWRYQEGVTTHVGIGHSDEITAVAICPGMKNIISASKDGAICIWKYPAKLTSGASSTRR